MAKSSTSFEPNNEAATKHGAYGLKKRVETGLTTKDDYQRFVALLDKWGLTPADMEGMGMLGSVIKAKAWQGVIADDSVGGYLFWKESHPNDLEAIIRLGRNASYQLKTFESGLVELAQTLKSDDGAIEAAYHSAKGNNGNDSHTD